MVTRNPFHHKGAIISYAIGTIVILFLLAVHIIATYNSTKQLRKRIKHKAPRIQKKSFKHHYLTTISCGLSILCYLIISVSALMAESHFPTCFCDKLPKIILNCYVIGKAINAFFFVIRAKASQGMLNIFPSQICGLKFPSKDAMFDIWLPALLFSCLLLYLFLWNIGAPIFSVWSGVCIHEPYDLGCQYIMSSEFLIVTNLSPLLDVSMSLMLLYLFYVPILKVTNMSWKKFIDETRKRDEINDADMSDTQEKFIYILKISLLLSLVNILSSTLTLSVLPHIPEFWWLFSIDYIVNSFCTFLLVGNDRRLLEKIICCCRNKHIDIKINSNDNSEFQSNKSDKSSQKPSLKSMDTMQAMEQVEMENKNETLIVEKRDLTPQPSQSDDEI